MFFICSFLPETLCMHDARSSPHNVHQCPGCVFGALIQYHTLQQNTTKAMSRKSCPAFPAISLTMLPLSHNVTYVYILV
jgi:hypothetical protein